MKEQKLIEMFNKIEKIDSILKDVINEMLNIKSISVGTLEALKRMKGYEKAIEQLKKDAEKAKEEKKENK
tara:strand:- start:702 stop:911 length:210 start_codon:yes stop_codon:yes gene_type:complete